MKRRLFTFFSAVSLILCLAFIALWPASFRHIGLISVSGVTLQIRRGAVEAKRLYEYGELIMEEDWTGPLDPATMRKMPRHDYGALAIIYTLGEERRGDGLPEPLVHPRIGRYWSFRLPLWLPILATCWLPIWWLAREPARRRREYRLCHGLCLTCAYDLRAHAAGQHCPECGVRVPPKVLNAT